MQLDEVDHMAVQQPADDIANAPSMIMLMAKQNSFCSGCAHRNFKVPRALRGKAGGPSGGVMERRALVPVPRRFAGAADPVAP